MEIGHDMNLPQPDDTESTLGPSFGLKAGIGFRLFDNWEISLKASAVTIPLAFTRIDAEAGLRYGFYFVSESPTTAQQLPVDDEPEIENGVVRFSEVVFQDVFPAFYKQYADRPIAEAVIYNDSSAEITDVRVELFIRRFMDDPQTFFVAGAIAAQEQRSTSLHALLTEEILQETEGTRVTGRVAILFRRGASEFREEQVMPVRILHRNATTWDDDRRICAFVTARDPLVLQFGKNEASWVQRVPVQGINENLLAAIAIHEALAVRDIRYVIDPESSYIELSQSDSVVDFLQFPRQTFQYGSGDCDDLSALYAALLEGIGVETGFTTIPGHIMIALKLKTSPERIAERFLRSDQLIVVGDDVWLPLETTMRDASFLEAWSEGAKQWRKHEVNGQATLYRTHAAWDVFEPVGFSEGGTHVELPSKDKVVAAYQNTVEQFVERQILDDVEKLLTRIDSADNPRDRNSLGVLYARYGLLRRAEPEFRRALELSTSNMSALVNLGHISFLNQELTRALDFYKRANELNPNHPGVILALARTNHELENYGTVKNLYGVLAGIDPDLANEYAYLDLGGEQTTRAADANRKTNKVEWEY